MKKNDNVEFDLDRMKAYMALPVEAKFKYLQEANAFFAKFRNKKTDKIRAELKRRGF
jgi:hypothetical protein